jgi:hypothetical protein
MFRPQSVTKCLRSWFAPRQQGTIRRPRQRVQLQCDSLEDRIVPTHFRYGTIDWSPHPTTPNNIEFDITQSWRRSFYTGTGGDGRPVVGDTVNVGTFNYGGTQGTATLNLTVTSINTTEDWLVGTIHLTKTYSTTGNFTAIFTGGNRISTLQGGNNDTTYTNQTLVNVGTGNSSPVSAMAPIVEVPDNQVWTFDMSTVSSDPNSDTLTYRLATQPEWGAIDCQIYKTHQDLFLCCGTRI